MDKVDRNLQEFWKQVSLVDKKQTDSQLCSAVMGGKYLVAVVGIVIAILVRKVQIRLESVKLPPGYSYNDESCELIGQARGLLGTEDLALGRHGVLFISSGDIIKGFGHGFSQAAQGGVWILDIRQRPIQEPVKLNILGVPDGLDFHLHGLDVSNSTDRLYAVNHQLTQSSVDVFQISYNIDCIQETWSCTPVSLEFVTTITSPLFPHAGINDVVEIDEDHFYVSQFQAFPMPAGGSHNSKSPGEFLRALMSLPIFLFSLKWTTVHVCSVSLGTCQTATEERFNGANGMTVSSDRQLVFVNDPMEKVVTVMRKEPGSYQLTKESLIKLPVPADNIEYDDETAELIIGTIPDVPAAMEHMMGNKSVAVPGGMAIASRLPTGGWQVRDVLEHDGTKLAQISAAARYGGTVILGSPGSEGLLVCYDVKY